MSGDKQSREGLILRVLWMVVFAIVWQVAELVLVALVLVQLVLRLINGAASRTLMDFGDSLSQYLAQIGRFGTFHTEEKPWPFADWPAPREAQDEASLAPAPAPAPAPAAATPPVVVDEPAQAEKPAAVTEPVVEQTAVAPDESKPVAGAAPVTAETTPDTVETAPEGDGETKDKTAPNAPAEPKA